MKLYKAMIIVLLCSQNLISQENRFGLGVVLGDPTGLSAQLRLNNTNAIDGALAWSATGLHIHSDYLWNNDNFFANRNQNLDLYYGIGGRLISLSSDAYKNQTSIAVRAPIGINYKIRNTQVQIFAEMALNFSFAPRSDTDLDAGIGLRFYF